jgi:hypothetical protein
VIGGSFEECSGGTRRIVALVAVRAGLMNPLDGRFLCRLGDDFLSQRDSQQRCDVSPAGLS